MSLYNLRTVGTAFAITKFDADFNVESTYTLTPSRNGHFDCDCPAGSRSVVTKPCRHRLMLPFILPAVDTNQFYDYDTKKFCEPLGDLLRPTADLTGREELSEYNDMEVNEGLLDATLTGEALFNEQEASERIGDNATAQYPIEPFVKGDKGLNVHQAVEAAYTLPATLAPTIRRR